MAYTAYHNSLGDSKGEVIDGFTPDQRFYLSYANVWAGNIRDEEILLRTKTDPHSLGKWRVNGALRNLEGFYEAFGIKEGDAMWMHFNRSTENDYYFPLLEGQSLFPYDGRLMTFGGKRIDKEGESMGCLYVSNDNGITSKQDFELHLPFELR